MKYSLIIPHFNDADRLDRLLLSVPVARRDIEVLIVDDCSPDQESINRIKNRWQQVHWLSTNTNGGAGVARNVGLANATGDYLVFADSDDEFLPEAFDVFDTHIKPQDELVYFLSEAVQEKSGLPSNRAERMNEQCNDYLNEPSDENLLKLKLKHVNPVAKVYSRRLIEIDTLRFEEVRINDDIAFNVLAAVHANNVKVVPAVVYRVYRRTGSLMNNGENLENLKCGIAVLARLNLRLKSLNVSGRMNAGSFLYRAFRRGPKDFFQVFGMVLSNGLLWSTLQQFSLKELFGFMRRQKGEHIERKRL